MMSLFSDRRAVLARIGFEPTEAQGQYRREAFTLCFSGGSWATLSRELPDAGLTEDQWGRPLTNRRREAAPSGRTAARFVKGRPGLWKTVYRDSDLRNVFDIRLSARQECSHTIGDTTVEGPDALLLAQLEWAMSTADGELPGSWHRPAAHEIQACVPSDSLILQAGPVVRQGRLVDEESRLALVWPILSPLPAELAGRKQMWLRRLAVDAQSQWRMTRVGFDPDERSGLMAEVDLTGAPSLLLPHLLPLAVDALQWVVGRLTRSVTFITDSAADCRALDSSQWEHLLGETSHV